MATRNDLGTPICGHCGSTNMRIVNSRELNPYTTRVVYVCLTCKEETAIDTDCPPKK